MADYGQFIGRLVRGEIPTASTAELDALLHWLAGRSNEQAAAVATAFNAHGASTDTARRHALRYLDSTLFRRHHDYYRLFGLSPNASLSAIRTRHKQLLQTFHPDRHTQDRDWFTNRTEQLNRAYAYLKRHHGKPRPVADAPRAATAAAAPRRTQAAAPARRKQRPSLAVYKARLRRRLQAYLGNPLRFERRLYIVLYSVPAILFLLAYLNHAYTTDGVHANGGGPGDAESRMIPRHEDEATSVGGAGGKNNTRSSQPLESPRPGSEGSDADHRFRTLDAFSPDGIVPRQSMPGQPLPVMSHLSSPKTHRLGPSGYREGRDFVTVRSGS